MADGIGALGDLQAQMGGSQLPGQNTAVTRVIMHYFQNRGIPLNVGLQAVQKQLAEGLKLIPYKNSVMGLKSFPQRLPRFTSSPQTRQMNWTLTLDSLLSN
jgi:hypothetical protein